MVAGNVERRSMGALGRMGIVAGAHAALILLVGRGLGIVPPLIDDKPPDILTTLVDRPVPIDDRPQVIDPKMENVTVRVPPPEDPAYEPNVDTAINAVALDPDEIDID